MPSYLYKDNAALAYDANKKRLRAEGAIVLASVMNEALNEMTDQFNKALNEGKILEIGGSREEMKSFLRLAAQRELGDGS
jgi:hypothetical protein